ncbi:hypothetical protein [Alteribacillus sp. HJP-4]|uniref:hypothetical protein n=1 Tax=Alteribacillus sp. HJP-4 TaxID=2775394 RepID=UPI0035CCC90C
MNRADIIAVPSSWNGQYGGEMEIDDKLSENPYPKNAMVTWDALAIGSQAYTVVGNFTGTEQEYLGGAGAYGIDPLYGLDEVDIASEDEEEAKTSSFETLAEDWWFNQEQLIDSRQAHHYEPLIEE